MYFENKMVKKPDIIKTLKFIKISWIDTVADFLEKNTLLKILLIITLWYLSSILLLLLSNQYNLVLDFIWLIGGIGLALVFIAYKFFKSKLIDNIILIYNIIIKEEQQLFIDYIISVFKKLDNNIKNIGEGFILSILFFLFLLLNWYFQIGPVFFDFLGEEWTRKDMFLIYRICSLYLATLPIFIILCTGLRIILYMLKIVKKMIEFRFFPSPRICLRSFKFTLKYMLFISFTFTGLASLFIILFSKNLLKFDFQSCLYWAFCIGLISLGIISILYPIHIVKTIVNKLRDNRLTIISKQIIDLGEIDSIDKLTLTMQLYELEQQFDLIQKVDSFFLGWKYITGFMMSFFIPLFIAVSQVFLEVYISK